MIDENDDDIEEMSKEMENEKAQGIGMPVQLSNAAAQQQMVGDVEAEQQQGTNLHQAALDAAAPDENDNAPAAKKSSSSSSSSKPKAKPKAKSSGSKGDLSLEDTTFTRLKRIL